MTIKQVQDDKKKMFVLNNLSIKIKEKEILKNVSLIIKRGEIHALMGPNGCGKTTLAMGVMGNNKFKVQSSKFKVDRRNMFNLTPHERARRGLFVSFQNPVEIEGLSVFSFLRTSYNSTFPNKKTSILEFKKMLKFILKRLGMEEDFLSRYVNHGFSGGEKKKFEILQMLILRPKFAILDEIDSGLDIDNLRKIAKIIEEKIEENKMGILIISHSSKIFNFLKPQFVHILKNGTIKTFDVKILEKIERKGYAEI